MSSAALNSWQTVRTSRLDRLQAAHAAIGGAGPGRRWVTEELNQAMILRLASEFQGFARELHEEAVSAVAAHLAPGDPGVQIAISLPFSSGRRLDRGNADPVGLGQDFGLFGFKFWPRLKQRYPTKADQWNERLALLNRARNAIAHDDVRKLQQVADAGWSPTLRSVQRWHRSLDGLAGGMDDVVRGQLQGLYGTSPW